MKRSEMVTTVAQLLGNMDSTDPSYVRIPFALTNALTMVVRMAVAHEKASRDQMNLFPELETSWTSGGSVSGLTVTAGGSGYAAPPTVTLSAPQQPGGLQARATATLTTGAVSSLTLTEPGYGYTSAPTVTFSSGAATATAAITSNGTTQNGMASYPLPADKIAIYDVASYDDDTIGVNIGNARLEPMAKIPVRRLAAMNKDEQGYPRRFCYKENHVFVHPVPATGALTFLEFFGWKKDVDFTIVTSDDAVPSIDKDWHNPACQLAAYLMAVELGWGSDAQSFYDAGDKMIAQAIDVASLMQQDDEPHVGIHGWPDGRFGRD